MFLIGMPARFRPITATTAPVTTGGMKRSIQPVPTACTMAPMMRVDDAAGDDAAQRHADVGVGPLARVGGGGDHHADEGEARAQVAGHLAAGDEEEDQRADAAHEDGDVGIEPHEDGRQHRGAEHRDHVLHAHGRGLRPGQALVRRDHAALLQHLRPASPSSRTFPSLAPSLLKVRAMLGAMSAPRKARATHVSREDRPPSPQHVRRP